MVPRLRIHAAYEGALHMRIRRPLFVLHALLLCRLASAQSPSSDLGGLREMLLDRQHPRGQSQAALLVVQSPLPDAENVVRQGLRQTEDVEVFLALATAVRVLQDGRFINDLLPAFAVSRPGVRQAAAEAVAVLPCPDLVQRLQAIAEDAKADIGARQAAIWTLGRCGRKNAVPPLLTQIQGTVEGLRRAAAESLADLSGQNFGTDAEHWEAWWARHKDMSNECWLEQRLAYQTGRAYRLDSDLERARNQVLRLHQQFYNRLPAAERLGYIQSLVDQDDPAVRALAVLWAVEMLPAADAARQRLLAQVLVRLSGDGTVEVQRAAVLGLGRVDEPLALERLYTLLQKGRPQVRAAAARSLALQARTAGAEGQERFKQVIPTLQKALEDPALEVVVEAAEDLGVLGAQGAGPVLTGLLRHPSEPVRQAAAQALERVADPTVIDRLLDALDDANSSVRFSVVGALARAAGDGTALPEAARRALLTRLESLLVRDPDPGVRGRAATVLGECGSAAFLPSLWRCVTAGEDGRVQEKAWAALVEILARAGNVALVQEWDHTLSAAKQGPRRLQLLGELVNRWQRSPDHKAIAAAAQELLIQGQLDQGKWPAAFPQVRELLAHSGSEAELAQRLRWLLTIGEQALREGNRAEALRTVQEAQPYLPRAGTMAGAFEKLEKDVTEKE
jgi:HEAT repeat protein